VTTLRGEKNHKKERKIDQRFGQVLRWDEEEWEDAEGGDCCLKFNEGE
jgi:hypothetical protein